MRNIVKKSLPFILMAVWGLFFMPAGAGAQSGGYGRGMEHGNGDRGHGIGGQITAINGAQVTIRRHEDNATTSFIVTTATAFHKHHNQATYSDMHVGDHVHVEGIPLNGHFEATRVSIFGEGERRQGGRNGFGGQSQP